MKWIPALLVAVIVGVSLYGVMKAEAQTPSPAGKYVLTEIQKLRIKVKLEDAQIAQQNLSVAQAAFQNALNAFNAQVTDTEKENGWPTTLKIDPNTLEFSDAPAPPPDASPASAKPDPVPSSK